MSMCREDYLVYGVEITDKEIDNIMENNESKILPYIEGHNYVNCRIVGGACDSKKKKLFGIILKKSEENEGFQDESPIKLDGLKFAEHIIECEYKDCFDKTIKPEKLGLYLITDWR